MLKYALLGFLNYGPMTGYELKQVMDRSTAFFWHARQSQIYTTLKKLEAEGLLTSEVQAQESRPDRRVYTITEAGQADLQAWLATPITNLESRKERLLLKIFFSAAVDKEALLTQLRLQRELHHRQAEHYRTETKAVIQSYTARMPGLERDVLLWEATRRFGELYETMYTRWLDETIALVEEKL